VLTVPAEIIKKTTRCRNNFLCLETNHCGDRPMCDVETTHGENVLCIRAADWRNCSYHLDFGGAKFCVCPVRCEIYRQQGR
jgi:hypothetical protein